MFRFVALFFVVLTLSACAHTAGPRESTGTLLGAGAGALIGSQFGGGEGRLVGTALGALAGAMIGQDMGRTLDRVDRQYLEQTTQQSLETVPSNQTSSWVNPDTGNSGSITPTRTYQNRSGAYCREYRQTVTVAGEQQQAYGTACRQPDGSWRMSSAERPAPRAQVIRQTRVYVREPVYYPTYWPFFTTLSLSFGDHDHWGFGGHWGHHRRHHGYWGWDD